MLMSCDSRIPMRRRLEPMNYNQKHCHKPPHIKALQYHISTINLDTCVNSQLIKLLGMM